MLRVADFFLLLNNLGIRFYTGVPDSLLKNFCAYLADNVSPVSHIIAANEGNSIALAAGYHLGTGQLALVYMQNSGLGNAANPLISLTDPKVYGLPLLLLIGWRGEPGKKDEPQHIKQGEITLKFLETLDIPYSLLSEDLTKTEELVKKAVNTAMFKKQPYALIVKKGLFDEYQLKNKQEHTSALTREQAIKLIISKLDSSDFVVSSTGKISRELFELREKNGQNHSHDFLTVGSMGHSSQIALGLALSQKSRKIYCLDGDGAILMQMGALAINGVQNLSNFKHIILNNGVHDSVGGQPTVALKIDLPAIAKACGYQKVLSASTQEQLLERLELLRATSGATCLEIKVARGSRPDLGRPTSSPQANKEAFMEAITHA